MQGIGSALVTTGPGMLLGSTNVCNAEAQVPGSGRLHRQRLKGPTPCQEVTQARLKRCHAAHLAAAAMTRPVHCDDIVPSLGQQAARGSVCVAAAAQAVQAQHGQLARGGGRGVGGDFAVGKREAACSRVW